MKKLLMSAAAAAVLALGAAPATADVHACLDAFCFNEALFTVADTTVGGGAAVSLESPRYGDWGFDLTGMDRSISPGDDFYSWANGAWFKRTEIPSDRTRFGNFDALSVLSEARVRSIIEDAAAGKVDSPDAARIGAAWTAFMDEARIEALGARRMAP